MGHDNARECCGQPQDCERECHSAVVASKARHNDPLTRITFDVMGATLAVGLTVLLVAAFVRATLWILGV